MVNEMQSVGFVINNQQSCVCVCVCVLRASVCMCVCVCARARLRIVTTDSNLFFFFAKHIVVGRLIVQHTSSTITCSHSFIFHSVYKTKKSMCILTKLSITV